MGGVFATEKPVLVLGAGINGAAIARELLLSGVSVCVVDTADVSSGTTPYSSRLIHGGLRYLEYGEFDLVRESLEERTRLLKLAPQFVRPLQLFIPVTNRFGGLVGSARRFLGWERKRTSDVPPARGVWLVRLGLWFYDKYARDPTLPGHMVHTVRDPDAPRVDATRYRWFCSYYDAQLVYPERFVLGLLEDARRIAEPEGIAFELWTYHEARLVGKYVELFRLQKDTPREGPVRRFEAAAIINATGAWVDQTLRRLSVPSVPLIGGTKGSHFVTSHSRLREALRGKGIYAEAIDSRPFFLLPLAGATLVGTTDLPFEGDPRDAVASPQELEYLIESANRIVPEARLSAADVDVHYCGVRPLPQTRGATPGSITRRHWLEENRDCAVPLFSVIGGKLTTCRSLAELSAKTVLARLDHSVSANSRDRIIPGGEDYPDGQESCLKRQAELATRLGLSLPQVQSVWSLVGTRAETILSPAAGADTQSVAGTTLPRAFVRWVIENEWVSGLADLVERRLMLLFAPELSEGCLRELAGLLVEAGKIRCDEVDVEVQSLISQLERRHGKRIHLDAGD